MTLREFWQEFKKALRGESAPIKFRSKVTLEKFEEGKLVETIMVERNEKDELLFFSKELNG